MYVLFSGNINVASSTKLFTSDDKAFVLSRQRISAKRNREVEVRYTIPLRELLRENLKDLTS